MENMLVKLDLLLIYTSLPFVQGHRAFCEAANFTFIEICSLVQIINQLLTIYDLHLFE